MLCAFSLLLLAAALLPAQETGCLLEIVAGGGRSFSGDGGPAELAEFDHPEDAAARPDGSLYISDTGNGRVRWISPDGLITTVLRTPEPARIAVSPEGDLFVFDRAQRRIVRRMTNGFVRTVLADAGLGGDVGLDAAPGPTLYLADADHHRVLRLDRNGRMTTVAKGGELLSPSDVAVGLDGSLFVATPGRIQRISPDGSIVALTPRRASLHRRSSLSHRERCCDSAGHGFRIVDSEYWRSSTSHVVVVVLWRRPLRIVRCSARLKPQSPPKPEAHRHRRRDLDGLAVELRRLVAPL